MATDGNAIHAVKGATIEIVDIDLEVPEPPSAEDLSQSPYSTPRREFPKVGEIRGGASMVEVIHNPLPGFAAPPGHVRSRQKHMGVIQRSPARAGLLCSAAAAGRSRAARAAHSLSSIRFSNMLADVVARMTRRGAGRWRIGGPCSGPRVASR